MSWPRSATVTARCCSAERRSSLRYRTAKPTRRVEPPGVESVSEYLPAASSLLPWRRLRSNPRAAPDSRTVNAQDRAPAQRITAVTGVSALSA